MAEIIDRISELPAHIIYDILRKLERVLELTRCYEIKKIKIVSHKIKRFTLCHWKNLKQVDLLTPNLREFDFESGNMCMPFSTMDLSNLKRANIFFYKCGSKYCTWKCGLKLE
ncbi:hypothetical protein H5410_019050 [Solanum commersonii]|uniref:At1g61320/AtMIF1 LRR domain-containing protein n=1 Tax=Solanum commersonii TaxID=4109 RepID=A0A9J6A4F6_SOLCO|nr:hypothetical protein H5410_019050 [Solanum commersonii]